MNIVPLKQRTPEWYAWRNSGITASDGSVLLAQHPTKTKYRLYLEKKGLIRLDDLSRNPHVRRGNELEPLARSAYQEKHDTLLLPVCAESESDSFMKASFDGLDDNRCPVELKAPDPSEIKDLVENKKRSRFFLRAYPQVQFQIYVCDAEYGHLSFYYHGKGSIDFKIPRNETMINLLVGEAKLFYDGMIHNIPPLPDEKLDIFIPEGEVLEQWTVLAASYREIDQQLVKLQTALEPLEARKREIESHLLELVGEFAKVQSQGVSVSRHLRKGAIDYPELLKKFCPNLSQKEIEAFRKPYSQVTSISCQSEEKAKILFSENELNRVGQSKSRWF